LSLSQNVQIPHPAEQTCPPHQLLFHSRCLFDIEEVGEHPDGAAEPAYRYSDLVNDVLTGAQLGLGVNDYGALFCHIVTDDVACGGRSVVHAVIVRVNCAP
jgi:hypothetical protein